MTDEPRLNDFYHNGSDWICRQCEAQRKREQSGGDICPDELPLARWTDKTRRFLTCPQCGLTESVEIS